MQYNLEYHKYLDRSHILPNLLQGAYMGIVSQFLSDLFISLLSNNNSIIITDIEISSIASYYASVITGMLSGFLIIFIDQIALVVITTVFYSYTFNLINELITGQKLELTPVETTFDAAITVLLVALFDPTARSQYYRYQQKRHFIEPTIPRTDRNLSLIIFFSILTSTYGFLKQNSRQTSANS